MDVTKSLWFFIMGTSFLLIRDYSCHNHSSNKHDYFIFLAYDMLKSTTLRCEELVQTDKLDIKADMWG